MTSQYLRRDAIIAPLKELLRAALEHPALFETRENRVAEMVMPCPAAMPRETLLRHYRPADRDKLIAAGEQGYVPLLEPLARLFRAIPPVLADRPLRLNIAFSRWEQSMEPGVYLPVEIAALSATIGGAYFMSATPSGLARQMAAYLAEHEGMQMEGELHAWHFDAPEVAEHIQPYQGLLADTARNAIARLSALSKPVREFLREGGEIKADRADRGGNTGVEKPTSGGPSEPRNRGPVLRV